LLERAGAAAAAGRDAVVPVTARGPEPLCAAYRRVAIAPIRRAIAAGDLRMTAFWPEVRVDALDEGELARFGPVPTLFANANTPEDYARARRELAPDGWR
jgi:molybdopterin-guanine dinucleotide biosynthesis protein A